MHHSLRLLILIILAATGCAGKDDVSPIDVERQAFEDLRSEIREVIDDPARESEALALVDSLVDDLASLREKISARRKQVRQLNADYDTTCNDFEAFFQQVDTEIRSNKRQVSQDHRALMSVTTPGERSTLSKAETKAMQAAIRNIQSL